MSGANIAPAENKTDLEMHVEEGAKRFAQGVQSEARGQHDEAVDHHKAAQEHHKAAAKLHGKLKNRILAKKHRRFAKQAAANIKRINNEHGVHDGTSRLKRMAHKAAAFPTNIIPRRLRVAAASVAQTASEYVTDSLTTKAVLKHKSKRAIADAKAAREAQARETARRKNSEAENRALKAQLAGQQHHDSSMQLMF